MIRTLASRRLLPSHVYLVAIIGMLLMSANVVCAQRLQSNVMDRSSDARTFISAEENSDSRAIALLERFLTLTGGIDAWRQVSGLEATYKVKGQSSQNVKTVKLDQSWNAGSVIVSKHFRVVAGELNSSDHPEAIPDKPVGTAKYTGSLKDLVGILPGVSAAMLRSGKQEILKYQIIEETAKARIDAYHHEQSSGPARNLQQWTFDTQSGMVSSIHVLLGPAETANAWKTYKFNDWTEVGGLSVPSVILEIGSDGHTVDWRLVEGSMSLQRENK